MADLQTKVEKLNRVGKSLANKLKRLGLQNLNDLIFYFPFRYDDFSRVVKISQLVPDLSVTVIGRVELLASRRTKYKRKILTEGLITDDSGSVKIIWFNQPWIAKNIRVGDTLAVSGRVTGDLFNLYFNSPDYEIISSTVHLAKNLTPIYSATEGLTQKQLRFIIQSALRLAGKLTDYLPLELVRKEELMALDRAVRITHSPADKSILVLARRRLAFDELFFCQLWSKILKKKNDALAAKPIIFQAAATKKFISRLPFELTLDQKKSAWEILKDLARPQPMNRLLEGDVGSGKTLVALIALYNTALNGCQGVMMAPTEILASQHYQTFLKLLSGENLGLGLLTRSQKFFNGEKISAQKFQEKLKNNELKIIVGTHALIQKTVDFANLGLVVVDEQHRFGVSQRQVLKEKSLLSPHFLALTATPIPRSLALIIYGDLSLSIIKQMPPGRQPIITRVVPNEKRQLAYEFIAKQISAGRQVFVICPLIDPSDKLGVKSVKEEFEKLDQEIFPHLPVGLLHGRLKAGEKEAMMKKFLANEISILIATSVVEVGIDVPNATVMMIESADRFGLSQLHQFRGRVGRGGEKSYCFLFTDNDSPLVVKRLEFLTLCSDGFALANRDLELRGAGNIYGYEQSGFFSWLKIADLRDLTLIKKAAGAAEDFLNSYNLDDYPLLKEKLSDFEELEGLE